MLLEEMEEHLAVALGPESPPAGLERAAQAPVAVDLAGHRDNDAAVGRGDGLGPVPKPDGCEAHVSQGDAGRQPHAPPVRATVAERIEP